MLELTKQFRSKHLNLPIKKGLLPFEYEADFEESFGFIQNDLRMIIQISIQNVWYTFNIMTEGSFLSDRKSTISINDCNLNHLELDFVRQIPEAIKQNFPHLNEIITKGYTIFPDKEKIQYYKFDGSSACLYITSTTPIEKDVENSNIMELIHIVSLIKEIELEYERYKRTNIYKIIKGMQKNRTPKRNDMEFCFNIIKIARVALKLYNIGDAYLPSCDNNIDNIGLSFDSTTYDFLLSDSIKDDTLFDIQNCEYNDTISPTGNSDILNCEHNDTIEYTINYTDNTDNSDIPNCEHNDTIEYTINFTGNSDSKISDLNNQLTTVNHQIDYYTKEIRNFDDKTSSTYRSNCLSELNRLTTKANDIVKEINKLKSR